jgi:large conductance mechanosensitive channel
MTGFRQFLMRGNLIELAVAFIMGAAFATVVSSFTKLVLNVIGLIVDVQGFSTITVRGINLGEFITAVITFVLTAAVVYFLIVVPYNKVSAALKADEPAIVAPSAEDLLTEIRDLLRERG